MLTGVSGGAAASAAEPAAAVPTLPAVDDMMFRFIVVTAGGKCSYVDSRCCLILIFGYLWRNSRFELCHFFKLSASKQ